MRHLSVLRQRHGLARGNELGLTKRQLRLLVERGELRSPARGWYALPEADPLAMRAVALGGRLACVSALRSHGCDVPGDASVLHYAVPSHHRVRRRGPGVRHFEDVADHGGAYVQPLPDALVRAMLCRPYLEALATLELVARTRGPELLEDVLRRVAAVRSGLAADLATDVDLASRSAVETRVRLALRAAGLHVVAGARIPGIGEVDLLVEGCVIVEIDGFAYHGDRKQYRADRRRDRAAARLGLVVLRFAFEDADAVAVVAEVALHVAALRHHPHQPLRSVPPAVIHQLREVAARGENRSSWRARKAVGVTGGRIGGVPSDGAAVPSAGPAATAATG